MKTENELIEVETNSSLELKKSKSNLNNLQIQLDSLLDKIESFIDQEKLTKDIFKELKDLVKKITSSQEEYAEKYSKNKSIQSDSIKRKRENKKY